MPGIPRLWQVWSQTGLVRPRLSFLTTQIKKQQCGLVSPHDLLAKHSIRLRILLICFQLTCTKTEISYPQKRQNKGPRKFNLPKFKQHPRPGRAWKLRHSRKGRLQAEQGPLEPSPGSWPGLIPTLPESVQTQHSYPRPWRVHHPDNS